jgi:hypothetical protein
MRLPVFEERVEHTPARATHLYVSLGCQRSDLYSSKAKMRFQSFFMLMMLQPFFVAF